jgi:hypothetical protein
MDVFHLSTSFAQCGRGLAVYRSGAHLVQARWPGWQEQRSEHCSGGGNSGRDWARRAEAAEEGRRCRVVHGCREHGVSARVQLMRNPECRATELATVCAMRSGSRGSSALDKLSNRATHRWCR